MKYDVIIVGAGSACCVLAARLSEDSRRSVLLLEAGPDYPDLERLPDDLKYSYGQGAAAIQALHNWSFVGTATPAQVNPILVPRGRVVGGSSAINGQIFLRGTPEDFDNWAGWGNDEWAYLKVLPYFRKLETDADIRDDFHGSDGPVPVRRVRRESWPAFHSAFYQACLAAGFPENPDLNGPESAGVGAVPFNVQDGIRMSTALTYLNSSRHRLNLTIRAGVLVRRILLDGTRATGLEVESAGERFTVEGEEIILAAGAISSPHLLMLSGVGPREHLSDLGIRVARNLPGVGQNLRDHPQPEVRLLMKEGFTLGSDAPKIQTVLRYTASGSSAPNDVQILPTTFSIPPGQNPPQGETIRIFCQLYLAIGAGELRLTSTDPYVQPHLNYRYLEDPWDRQRLRENIRICIRLLEHEAFRDLIAERLTPTDEDLSSDEALDTWLLANVNTAHHISGTCKMGPASDTMAVVDQYCRVHGLEGLRVVDASVMPDVVRANTNATVIMIGEHAADLIKTQL